jgi:hypothetical protein
MADWRRGVAIAGAAQTTVRVGSVEMVLDPALLDPALLDPALPDRQCLNPDGVLALPGFDEYLLGFKDRSLMVAAEHLPAIIPGGNGVFQPTIVRAGRVIATWKRTHARSRTVVDVRPLIAVGGRDRVMVERALECYGRFAGRSLEIRWP